MQIDTKNLRKKQLDAVLASSTYGKAISDVVHELQNEAKITPNEKTLETRFDQLLTLVFSSFFTSLGYDYKPIKEEAVDTVRAITKGHADTSIGNVVIEFKQPRTLSSEKDKESALKQAQDYITGFRENGIPKTYGFITDGEIAATYFVDDDNNETIHHFKSITEIQINELIMAIIGLNQKFLSPKNLVKDFAQDENSPSRKLALILFDVLNNNMSGKTRMLISEWKHLFRLSHNDVSQQQAIIDRRNSLAQYFKIDIEAGQNDLEYNALFALQTSYTILIKILAFKVISQVKYDDSLVHFSEFVDMDSETLRLQMENLESGAIIRDYGIQNLLEGDFFSWYVSKKQWNLNISKEIENIARLLDSYRGVSFDNMRQPQDFFKELYHEIIPAAVRHALGEYYTPRWLAERVTEKTLSNVKNPEWRALDPTCGSGTFLTILIQKIIDEGKNTNIEKADLLNNITSRVIGIDMNPLAVLTARVNYFLNIADYISPNTEVEIPVYSGDSAYIPEEVELSGVTFIKYSIDTELEPFNILFPVEALSNLKKFSRTMIEIELDIQNQDSKAILSRLMQLISLENRDNIIIKDNLTRLAKTFVKFESENWNGIWARIIANYLTTSRIGRFDAIVGNPPWVDWKNLPSNYRDKIKDLKITKTIFSGDGQTGGINLNIAALITNVSLSNWLKNDGTLGMLMPDTFLVQKTYEGYRRLLLSNGARAYFISMDDWSKSGNPFYPVTQKFYSYYIDKNKRNYSDGLPVEQFVKKRNTNSQVEKLDFKHVFTTNSLKAVQLNSNTTNFTLINDDINIDDFKIIASNVSEYVGREGIEFYPQELLIFQMIETTHTNQDLISVENIQVKKSKFKIPRKTRILEKKYFHPLIKGVDIKPFHAESSYVVPFVYDQSYSKRVAITEKRLREDAPKTFQYFYSMKEVFESQNSYSKNLINGNEIPYYSLARVGDYTFAPYFVAFRDNSKNVAAVIHKVQTPWGESKTPVFQNHAVTISQRPDGSYISEDEAYYIAGIINSKIINSFVLQSSDGRSFPIRPRFRIPLFGLEGQHEYQAKIVSLSKEAHEEWKDVRRIDSIRGDISEIYLDMLRDLDKNSVDKNIK